MKHPSSSRLCRTIPPALCQETNIMQYKTIVLELLQQQPELHEQLRASRTLLATMDQLAIELKASHEEWMQQLSQTRPGSDPIQISSEAAEIALQILEERLASASEAETEGPTLDAAMAYLRRHTPPE
jgi:hypothetical protein